MKLLWVVAALAALGLLAMPAAVRADVPVLDQATLDRVVAEVGEAAAAQEVNAGAEETHVSGDEPPFWCTPGEPGPAPTSVHKLRPEDVRVVAAMGDSITAAFGAKASSLLNVLGEWRGVSWSIGGDKSLEEGVVTLPNILRKFTGDAQLKGASTGKGGPSSKGAHFNVAVSGAIARDMPSQARTLVEKLKGDADVDFENDWKVVTMWIGGNDLCAVCKGGEDHFAKVYADYIEEALDILDQNVPRIFINLVLILDVSRLYPVHDGLCDLLHSFVCSCGTDKDQSVRESVAEMTLKYQELTNEILNKGKYEDRDDFTVVVQPFFEYTDVPAKSDGKPDRSYFAPDCFHFAEKAHDAAAVALWNNMIEPIGMKRTSWSPGEQFECPGKEHPYFYTKKNSVAAVQAAKEAATAAAATKKAGDSDVPLVEELFAEGSNDTALPPKHNSSSTVLAVTISVGSVCVLAGVALLVRRNKRGGYQAVAEDSS